MRTNLSRSAAESYLWFRTPERLGPFAIREPSMEGDLGTTKFILKGRQILHPIHKSPQLGL
jgi:hypothetical protein